MDEAQLFKSKLMMYLLSSLLSSGVVGIASFAAFAYHSMDGAIGAVVSLSFCNIVPHKMQLLLRHISAAVSNKSAPFIKCGGTFSTTFDLIKLQVAQASVCFCWILRD